MSGNSLALSNQWTITFFVDIDAKLPCINLLFFFLHFCLCLFFYLSLFSLLILCLLFFYFLNFVSVTTFTSFAPLIFFEGRFILTARLSWLAFFTFLKSWLILST